MVTLSADFAMGPYIAAIDFSGKQLVIIGNHKTLDAGEPIGPDWNQRFFYGSGSGSSLEIHNVTMRNGQAGRWYGLEHLSTAAPTIDGYGGAIFVSNGANVEIHDSIFQRNTATSSVRGTLR
jgi:hypothetical protein